MKIKLSKLKPNPDNPRTIDKEKLNNLKESLKKYEQILSVKPLLIDSWENPLILGGNMRYRALIEMGFTEIDEKYIKSCEHLTDEEKRALIVIDNTNYGEFDYDLLSSFYDIDELELFGVDVPHFDEIELETDVKDDNYEMPNEIKTDIVLGDLIEIGEHRLLCGDSTQTDTFKTLFGEQLADMVVTDPPYNVAYEGKTKDALKIENDDMSDSDFYQFLYDFYTALGSYTKAGGAWYVWQPDKYINVFVDSFLDSGFKFSCLNIWAKNTMVMGRGDYHSKHETCIYGWKEGAAHRWYSDRKQSTILEFDKPTKNAEHPTMKPVPLFAYQIGNSSKQGDIVADGFGGSGTTMVACHQMNRKAYLVELDPKYCQVIIDRMLKLDNTLDVKVNGIKYIGVNKDGIIRE